MYTSTWFRRIKGVSGYVIPMICMLLFERFYTHFESLVTFENFILLEAKLKHFNSDGGQADSFHCRRERAEGADGLGRRDEEQRLRLHRHLLRGHLQGGRLLDLHGTDGHQSGQTLQGKPSHWL